MPTFGLKVAYRPYACMACGNEQEVSTNHTDVCLAVCTACSWKMNYAPGVMLFGKMHRSFKYIGGDVTADEVNPHARQQVTP